MPRMIPHPKEIQQYLELLDDTLQRITACTAERDDADLANPPGPRAWSAIEILAHLRACSDLWSYSIYAMLAHESPALALLDEREWARARRYTELSFQRSFQTYSIQREELLFLLRSLPVEDWERKAVLEGRSHSVFSQVRRIALHEQEHCAQIEAGLNGS